MTHCVLLLTQCSVFLKSARVCKNVRLHAYYIGPLSRCTVHALSPRREKKARPRASSLAGDGILLYRVFRITRRDLYSFWAFKIVPPKSLLIDLCQTFCKPLENHAEIPGVRFSTIALVMLLRFFWYDFGGYLQLVTRLLIH